MKLRWKIAQFFEAIWWKNYLSSKTVEEYLDWKLNYWNSFLEKEKIEIQPNEKVMEAGCGPAGIFIAVQAKEVVAIDPLLEKYESQLAHFQVDMYSGVQFEKTTMEQFERPGYFDRVFCLNVINHVDDIELSFANLCGSLKESGILHLSVDSHNYGFVKTIFRLMPGDILHPHQLELKEYCDLLLANGMQIKQTRLIKPGFIFNYYLITAEKT